MVSNLARFQHVLWTSFQVSFLSDFVCLLKPFEAPFGTIFEQKPFRKSLQKKGLSNLKTSPYPRVRWLPETPPRVRTSRTETIVRARILVRIQLEFEWLLEFVFKLLFELIAIKKIEK